MAVKLLSPWKTRDRTACHSLDEVKPLGYSNTQSKESILLSSAMRAPRSVVPSHWMQGGEVPRPLSKKPIIALQKLNFVLDKLWGAL
jgi:hypothetical protein